MDVSRILIPVVATLTAAATLVIVLKFLIKKYLRWVKESENSVDHDVKDRLPELQTREAMVNMLEPENTVEGIETLVKSEPKIQEEAISGAALREHVEERDILNFGKLEESLESHYSRDDTDSEHEITDKNASGEEKDVKKGENRVTSRQPVAMAPGVDEQTIQAGEQGNSSRAHQKIYYNQEHQSNTNVEGCCTRHDHMKETTCNRGDTKKYETELRPDKFSFQAYGPKEQLVAIQRQEDYDDFPDRDAQSKEDRLNSDVSEKNITLSDQEDYNLRDTDGQSEEDRLNSDVSEQTTTLLEPSPKNTLPQRTDETEDNQQKTSVSKSQQPQSETNITERGGDAVVINAHDLIRSGNVQIAEMGSFSAVPQSTELKEDSQHNVDASGMWRSQNESENASPEFTRQKGGGQQNVAVSDKKHAPVCGSARQAEHGLNEVDDQGYDVVKSQKSENNSSGTAHGKLLLNDGEFEFTDEVRGGFSVSMIFESISRAGDTGSHTAVKRKLVYKKHCSQSTGEDAIQQHSRKKHRNM